MTPQQWQELAYPTPGTDPVEFYRAAWGDRAAYDKLKLLVAWRSGRRGRPRTAVSSFWAWVLSESGEDGVDAMADRLGLDREDAWNSLGKPTVPFDPGVWRCLLQNPFADLRPTRRQYADVRHEYAL